MAGPSTLFQTGVHGSRPAASSGCVLYSCTTHGLIYKSDGASWTTFATITSTGLADPMTTRGDSIYRNSSNVTDRLALPAAGQVIGRSGSDLGAIYPPGYEFDYVQGTGDVNVTGTNDAGANTVLTGNAVTYDGSTAIVIHFYSPQCFFDANGRNLIISLWDSGTEIGRLANLIAPTITGGDHRVSVKVEKRITPSAAAHTYIIKAHTNAGTQQVSGGAGTTSTLAPMFMRITKV